MKTKFFLYLSIALTIAVVVLSILLNRSCKSHPDIPIIHSDTTYFPWTTDTLTDTLKQVHYLTQHLSKSDSLKIYNLFASQQPIDTETFNMLIDYYTERNYDTTARNDSTAYLRLFMQSYTNKVKLLGYELSCKQKATQIVNTTVVNNFKNRVYLGLGINYFWTLPKYPITVTGNILFVTKKNLALSVEADPLSRYIGVRGYWKLSIKK